MRIVVVLIGVILIAAGAFLVFGPQEPAVRGADATSVSTSAAIHFRDELQGRVIAELGQPIEGFEPFMFMQVYAGLEPSDFEGVAAAQGVYTAHGGEVVFERTSSDPKHSAARAITAPGMRTLLANVAARLGMPAQSEAEVDTLLRQLR